MLHQVGVSFDLNEKLKIKPENDSSIDLDVTRGRITVLIPNKKWHVYPKYIYVYSFSAFTAISRMLEKF